MASPAGATYFTSARFNWLMVAVALVALAITAFVQVRYGFVRWTAWALPVLTIFNLAMIRIAPTRPRLTKVWLVISIAVTLAMFVSLVAPMLRRS